MLIETYEVNDKITRPHIINFVNNLGLKYENDFSLKNPIPTGLSEIDLLDPYYDERNDIIKFIYEDVLIEFIFLKGCPFSNCYVALKYSNDINEKVKKNVLEHFCDK